MLLHLVPNLLERCSAGRRMRRHGRPHQAPWRPPVLECLEVRLLPALILWDGGPAAMGTNWNDPVNWAGDALPGANDDTQIGTAFAGRPIDGNDDGQPGGDYIATISRGRATVGSVPLSPSSATAALVAVAVDAVFARGEQQGGSFIHSGRARHFTAVLVKFECPTAIAAP